MNYNELRMSNEVSRLALQKRRVLITLLTMESNIQLLKRSLRAYHFALSAIVLIAEPALLFCNLIRLFVSLAIYSCAFIPHTRTDVFFRIDFLDF